MHLVKSFAMNDAYIEFVKTTSEVAVGHVISGVHTRALALYVEMLHSLATENDTGST